MIDILNKLQTDLKTSLEQGFENKNIAIELYDTAPVNLEDTEYPFLCFGEISVQESGCKTFRGIEVEFNFHIYSNEKSSTQIKSLTMLAEDLIAGVTTNLDIVINQNIQIELFDDPEFENIKRSLIVQKIIAWEV